MREEVIKLIRKSFSELGYKTQAEMDAAIEQAISLATDLDIPQSIEFIPSNSMYLEKAKIYFSTARFIQSNIAFREEAKQTNLSVSIEGFSKNLSGMSGKENAIDYYRGLGNSYLGRAGYNTAVTLTRTSPFELENEIEIFNQ